MTLTTAIEEIKGLRFMTDNLELQSGWAKRMLHASPYLHTAEEINRELEKTEEMTRILRDASLSSAIDRICLKLAQVKDIRGSIARTRDSQNLDDLELFEIKAFALLVADIRQLLESGGIRIVPFPDLEPVIAILDPEGMRIPHFYVYDAYSPELSAIRKKMKSLAEGAETELEALRHEHTLLEDRIREQLSSRLHTHAEAIQEAFQKAGELDIVIAKGKQVLSMRLCRPRVSQGATRFKKIFNPQVREALAKEGKRFQPVDVSIAPKATLISGANMTGKSVILKTVALAQTLFQFGFHVPAEEAEIAPVDGVRLCTGDEQDELQGLSSYASEMLRVNSIAQEVKGGANLLVLVDELARTTNPNEGRAIVNAVLDFLSARGTRSLITSHYGGIEADCLRMRVRGFVSENVSGRLTIDNINEHIDYSLVEDSGDTVPQEAIRIARLLGVDNDLLDSAEHYLEENITNTRGQAKAENAAPGEITNK